MSLRLNREHKQHSPFPAPLRRPQRAEPLLTAPAAARRRVLANSSGRDGGGRARCGCLCEEGGSSVLALPRLGPRSAWDLAHGGSSPLGLGELCSPFRFVALRRCLRTRAALAPQRGCSSVVASCARQGQWARNCLF